MVMNEVFGEEMSLDEAEDMVRVVDNEGKGFITFDEFREVMLNGI
jgi:Ca2+-binding EF-hand superfamily protein